MTCHEESNGFMRFGAAKGSTFQSKKRNYVFFTSEGKTRENSPVQMMLFHVGSYKPSSITYSRTSTNCHLSVKATLYFVPADSPYIYSHSSLSTTATATNACPRLLKHLSPTASFFFSATDEKVMNGHELIRIARL